MLCLILSQLALEAGQTAGGIGDASKKTKFVSLYGQDGKAAESVQLAGRHPCDCQTLRHALVNNCLACGKIVCVQVILASDWSIHVT